MFIVMRQVQHEVRNNTLSFIDEILLSEFITSYEVNLHVDESVNIIVYNTLLKT